jgi:hypothetical protein
MKKLLRVIADEGNTFQIAKDYGLTLWDVRLLRLEPNAAIRYILDADSAGSVKTRAPSPTAVRLRTCCQIFKFSEFQNSGCKQDSENHNQADNKGPVSREETANA